MLSSLTHLAIIWDRDLPLWYIKRVLRELDISTNLQSEAPRPEDRGMYVVNAAGLTLTRRVIRLRQWVEYE